ncbi:MAG: orotate phosphoribosyltransferase [Deltaproteobacteria bacterium]|nr:orotate phosphoribosyltransferase [Deltaproteobacteria bacterium]
MISFNESQALELFRASGAYLDGHFLLTSGRHSSAYVEKFQVLQYPEHCARLCAAIADAFRDLKPDVVVGPAVGGIVLAYETARALGVRGIFLEREEGKLALRRGFEIGPTEKVLIVEDVVTTGTSVFEVLDALKREKHEGRILGVGYLVDRSGGDVDFGVGRQVPVMRLDLPTWDPASCPLCKESKPLTKRGSRKVPGA